MKSAALRFAGNLVPVRRARTRGAVRILSFHDVAPAHLSRLAEVLRLALRFGSPIGPQRLFRIYDPVAPEPLAAPAIMVSFDDGMRSSFDAIQHVCNPLGLKCAVFVPTAVLELDGEDAMRRFAATRIRRGRVAPGALVPHEYEPMTEDDLRRLVAQGHMVLPHSHSHAVLSMIDSRDGLHREVTAPKRILERLLERPCEGFALPGGGIDSLNGPALTAIGDTYRLCFTGVSGRNTERTNPLLLHRNPLRPDETSRHARNVMRGAFDGLYTIRTARPIRRLQRAVPAA